MSSPNPFAAPPASDFKVIYHVGDTIDIKTRIQSGTLSFTESEVSIRGRGRESLLVPYTSLREVELFRYHGLGRIVRVAHSSGTFFVSVARLNLWGYFVIIDFLGAGMLADALQSRLPIPATPPPSEDDDRR